MGPFNMMLLSLLDGRERSPAETSLITSFRNLTKDLSPPRRESWLPA